MADAVRILVTGSRYWTDEDAILQTFVSQVRILRAHPSRTTVVHGAARGADRIAARIAAHFGCLVESHPADWDRHGRAAGHRRNADMVALGADVCLAFPIGESRGTRGCMALAEQAGIPVVVREGTP